MLALCYVYLGTKYQLDVKQWIVYAQHIYIDHQVDVGDIQSDQSVLYLTTTIQSVHL